MCDWFPPAFFAVLLYLPTGAVPSQADQPAASELSAQMLIDFLAGRLTASDYDVSLASKIAR